MIVFSKDWSRYYQSFSETSHLGRESSYNWRLLSRNLKTAGRAGLIVIGAAYGLLRSLRLLGDINRNAVGLGTLQARVDDVNLAVARLANQTEQLQSKVEHSVTRDDLALTLDRVFGPLERGIDARFEYQTRSVEALRMMVGHTDELLQRVLDGLESMKAESDSEHHEQGLEWDLTRAGR
jgi:hypothetical protein